MAFQVSIAGKGQGKGQTKKIPCPVPLTGQTISYTTGDDGELQNGVSWPDPRFTDNGDGTVRDNLTNLIWTQNANYFGQVEWLDACSACNNLEDDGTSLTDGSEAGDWHLPNVREILSLVDYSQTNPNLPSDHLFTNIPSASSPYLASYWSSTTVANLTGSAWRMDLYRGYVDVSSKSYDYYAWCVRYPE